MKNKRIKITSTINRNKAHHVSLDVVIQFLDTIQRDQDVEVHPTNFITGNRLIIAAIKKDIPILNTLFTNTSNDIVFSIAMGIGGFKDILVHKMAKKKALYLFDAWPSQYNQIQRLIEINKTNLLFVTSKQSTEELAGRLQNCKVIWCPEGCNSEDYRPISYKNRNIDILALGRKYELLHEKIIESSLPLRYNYLYEKTPGEIIFPGHINFIKGLASSKILICYPRSITHPESSGQIETMTNRYLQGIASKVLLVGHCPREMEELFGYHPVVNLEDRDVIAHLYNILENFEDYISLIEKNYKFLCENHQWKNRWDFIKKHIQQSLF